MKMATDARAVRTHETIHPDWETVKAWAKRTFTKQRIADLVVLASTVAVLGMVLHILHSALENHAIVTYF
jgi:hypothetical protein